MPNGIENFRKQYPQYNDMSDEQLLGAFHKKYYSDLPYETFTQKFNQKFGGTTETPDNVSYLGAIAERFTKAPPQVKELGQRMKEDKDISPYEIQGRLNSAAGQKLLDVLGTTSAALWGGVGSLFSDKSAGELVRENVGLGDVALPESAPWYAKLPLNIIGDPAVYFGVGGIGWSLLKRAPKKLQKDIVEKGVENIDDVAQNEYVKWWNSPETQKGLNEIQTRMDSETSFGKTAEQRGLLRKQLTEQELLSDFRKAEQGKADELKRLQQYDTEQKVKQATEITPGRIEQATERGKKQREALLDIQRLRKERLEKVKSEPEVKPIAEPEIKTMEVPEFTIANKAEDAIEFGKQIKDNPAMIEQIKIKRAESLARVKALKAEKKLQEANDEIKVASLYREAEEVATGKMAAESAYKAEQKLPDVKESNYSKRLNKRKQRGEFVPEEEHKIKGILTRSGFDFDRVTKHKEQIYDVEIFGEHKGKGVGGTVDYQGGVIVHIDNDGFKTSFAINTDKPQSLASDIIEYANLIDKNSVKLSGKDYAKGILKAAKDDITSQSSGIVADPYRNIRKFIDENNLKLTEEEKKQLINGAMRIVKSAGGSADKETELAKLLTKYQKNIEPALEDISKISENLKANIPQETKNALQLSDADLSKIAKNAKGKLDKSKVGESRMLDNMIDRANVVKNQDELSDIRGDRLNFAKMKAAIDVLPPEQAERVVKELQADKLLSLTDRLVFGKEVQKHAADIIVDAVDGKLNKYIALYHKSAKQAGQTFRTQQEIFNDLRDELVKQLNAMNDPAQYKMARKILESFGIAEKGTFDPSKWNQFIEFSVMAKLMSVSAPVKAVVGNTISTMIRPVTRAGAGMLDAMVYGGKKIVGLEAKRNVYTREALSGWFGAEATLRKATRDAWQSLSKEGFTAGTRAEETMQHIGAIPGKFGYVVRTPGRVMGAIDTFFRTININAERYALAMRQGLSEGYRGNELAEFVYKYAEDLPFDLQTKAEQFGKEAVFQADLDKFTQQLDRLRTVGGGAGRLLIPFWRTPVNLWKQSLKHSVGTFILPSTWKALRGSDNALKYEIFSRAITGTALMTGIYYAFGDGNVSGRGSKYKTKTNIYRLTGWQPYSVKVGNTWISYQGFEPLSSWFRTIADVSEGIKEDSNPTTIAKDVINSYVKQFAENPFLLGLNDLGETVNDLERGEFPRFIATLAIGATVPTVLQQWGTRVYDPVIREPKGLTQTVMSKLPFGISKGLKAKQNIYGEAIVRPNPVMQSLGFSLSYENDSVLNKELARLARVEGGIGIGVPERNWNGVELNDAEYERLLQIRGTLMKETLDKLVNSPGYKQSNITDEMRVSAMRSVISKINTFAKGQVFGKYFMENRED